MVVRDLFFCGFLIQGFSDLSFSLFLSGFKFSEFFRIHVCVWVYYDPGVFMSHIPYPLIHPIIHPIIFFLSLLNRFPVESGIC